MIAKNNRTQNEWDGFSKLLKSWIRKFLFKLL